MTGTTPTGTNKPNKRSAGKQLFELGAKKNKQPEAPIPTSENQNQTKDASSKETPRVDEVVFTTVSSSSAPTTTSNSHKSELEELSTQVKALTRAMTQQTSTIHGLVQEMSAIRNSNQDFIANQAQSNKKSESVVQQAIDTVKANMDQLVRNLAPTGSLNQLSGDLSTAVDAYGCRLSIALIKNLCSRKSPSSLTKALVPIMVTEEQILECTATTLPDETLRKIVKLVQARFGEAPQPFALWITQKMGKLRNNMELTPAQRIALKSTRIDKALEVKRKHNNMDEDPDAPGAAQAIEM